MSRIDDVICIIEKADKQRHILEGVPEDTKQVDPTMIPLEWHEEQEGIDGKPEFDSDTDVLTWDSQNTVPDTLAMTQWLVMDANIWIPIFDGRHWCDFINKFEELRYQLKWTDAQSGAYLVRSMRPPVDEIRDTLRHWRYEAMVVYLTAVTAPVKPKLEAIEDLLKTRRKKNERLRALAFRISQQADSIPLVGKHRAILKGAAFRGL